LFLVTVGKYTIILSLLSYTLLPSCTADGEGALKVTLEKSSRRLQHWRGTTSTQELPLITGPQVHLTVLNTTIFLYQSTAPLIKHFMDFTSFINHPLQGKLAIYFCEINMLIIYMVITANTNTEK